MLKWDCTQHTPIHSTEHNGDGKVNAKQEKEIRWMKRWINREKNGKQKVNVRLGRSLKETISWLWESFGPLCLEGLRDSDAAEWGLATRAYSRPEGDRQINWSWDVCFLRVKWSGANGETCWETVIVGAVVVVGLAERLWAPLRAHGASCNNRYKAVPCWFSFPGLFQHRYVLFFLLKIRE